MPARKDRNKPKGRTTAFAYFLQAVQNELKKYPENERPTYLDLTRNCRAAWANVTPEQNWRIPFFELAEKDKVRYENEMRIYEANTTVAKKKKVKDPSKPKRNLTSFLWFCNDERSKGKALYPEYSFLEISKELGRLWGELDAERKQKYKILAVHDKTRYDLEMIAWRSEPISASEKKGDS